MAIISGMKTNSIVQISSTWGTAVAAGTGDKFVGEFTHSTNDSELIARSVGSGVNMASGATRGSTKPSISLVGDAHYQGAFGPLLAQFMGTDTVSSEITASQADYRHTITHNNSRTKLFTAAYESSDTTVHEFPSCSATSFIIRTPAVPGYLEFQCDAVANKLELSTAVNTNAVCAAATLTSTEIAAVAFDDDFWIDTQASTTLASGDQFDILSYELAMQKPLDLANEIKGSTGNGSPIETGEFTATLSVTVKGLTSHAFYDYYAAETKLKSRFTIEGSQIGSGALKSLNCYLPQMQIISAPSYAVVSAGVNPVTYVFKITKADSNPTGMSSTYPYFELVNSLSTGYLA